MYVNSALLDSFEHIWLPREGSDPSRHANRKRCENEHGAARTVNLTFSAVGIRIAESLNSFSSTAGTITPPATGIYFHFISQPSSIKKKGRKFFYIKKLQPMKKRIIFWIYKTREINFPKDRGKLFTVQVYQENLFSASLIRTEKKDFASDRNTQIEMKLTIWSFFSKGARLGRLYRIIRRKQHQKRSDQLVLRTGIRCGSIVPW